MMNISLEAGDLLLVSRPCHKMDSVSMSICYCAKTLGNSEFDHIGIVVEDPATQRLYLLEANINGVTKYPLKDRLLRSKASTFAVRKVVGDRGLAFRQSLWALALQYENKKYNSNFFSMVTATLMSYNALFDKAHQISLQCRGIEGQIALLQQVLPTLPPTCLLHPLMIKHLLFLRSSLQTFQNTLETLQTAYETSLSVKKIEKTFFCSELVAEVLLEINAFSRHRFSSHYIPADFSSASFVPIVGSMRGKGVRYAADVVVERGHIEAVEERRREGAKGGERGGSGEEGGELTVRLSLPPGHKGRVRMNVGDILPLSLLEGAGGRGVGVRGEVYVVRERGEEREVLAILRSNIGEREISTLLQHLEEREEERERERERVGGRRGEKGSGGVVLQAEQRSVITFSPLLPPPSSPSAPPSPAPSLSALSLQQRIFFLREVGAIVLSPLQEETEGGGERLFSSLPLSMRERVRREWGQYREEIGERDPFSPHSLPSSRQRERELLLLFALSQLEESPGQGGEEEEWREVRREMWREYGERYALSPTMYRRGEESLEKRVRREKAGERVGGEKRMGDYALALPFLLPALRNNTSRGWGGLGKVVGGGGWGRRWGWGWTSRRSGGRGAVLVRGGVFSLSLVYCSYVVADRGHRTSLC